MNFILLFFFFAIMNFKTCIDSCNQHHNQTISITPLLEQQRNYKGLKINVCIQLGQIIGKRYKKIKKSLLEQKLGDGNKIWVLHMSPTLTTTKGVSKTPKPRLQSVPGHIPLPLSYIRNKSALSAREQTREPVVCSHPHHCRRDPNNALPEFSIWPLINFY